MATTKLVEVLRQHENEILREWVKEQLSASTLRSDLMSEAELVEQSRTLLQGIREAVTRESIDTSGAAWANVREFLAEISRMRARQGFTPSETATFVLSLKQPLFTRLRQVVGRDVDALAEETWGATVLLDRLALLTTEHYQKTREEVIARQQQDMMELSTPVVELWDSILALPLIGTLDSARTQVVMENLLQKIVETGAAIAIVDITGVPTVDTLVAQHLLKTVTAIRLMGADCIISGVRPQIAQTIVHLGIDLAGITTKASLADALALALKKAGYVITRTKS